jgi:TolB-like protein/class 3 adenylate cyclase
MTATRRLAAILAADVAGYSRLMGEDEEGTHERLKAHLRDLVDPKIGEHHGRIVKNTGDGLLAEFPSVVDAVRCAVEVQRGMIDREPEVREERRIRFRIGVNLGDVMVEEHDIFGDGVNVAARLEALAEPGGICVSRMVRDQIQDKLPYPFDDMGEQTVKNIARPVRAYALRPEGLAALSHPGSWAPKRRWPLIGAISAAVAVVTMSFAWWFYPAETLSSRAGKPEEQTAAATPPRPTAPVPASNSQPLVVPRLSIVVLPFANLGNDPDQQYFADGITDDLTTDLSRIEDSFVISRNTAFTYRNKPVDAKHIGRELGVRYVLEGSVRRSGNQVRVNTQLIDAETDAHLWAERFDRDTGDLFALQNEITSRIANTLSLELIRAEAARPTADSNTLDYILRGRAAFAKGAARENYAEAISLFERALALDPRSVEAKTRLADALENRVLSQFSDSVADDLARAEELVDQALAASPQYALAHLVKGQVLRAKRRCEEALPEYQMVIALDHNSVGGLFNIGRCKMLTGSLDEAMPFMEQAIRLNPRNPFIGFYFQSIGIVHLLQSRTDEAIIWFEKACSANPGYWPFHASLASAYALRGETERAAAVLAEARRLSPDDRYSSIARMAARGYWGVPKVRALFEATYFAGLRKAGMPEE